MPYLKNAFIRKMYLKWFIMLYGEVEGLL